MLRPTLSAAFPAVVLAAILALAPAVQAEDSA